MKIRNSNIIKALVISASIATLQTSNCSATRFDWFWNFFSTANNPIIKPTLDVENVVENTLSFAKEMGKNIKEIPRTEISENSLIKLLNCTVKPFETITDKLFQEVVTKPVGWFSSLFSKGKYEYLKLYPKNIDSKYTVELLKKLIDSKNKMIGCIKENIIGNKDLENTCKKLLEKLEVFRKETNWESAQLQWEEIKLYVRNLLETPLFSNPYVKWTIISSITSYLTYKVIWRGMIYRFYKWCKDETPAQIYKRIEEIRNNHIPQNEAGYMSNETKFTQIAALTQKLKEYNQNSLTNALSWTWDNLSKGWKIATGSVGAIATIAGAMYLNSLYKDYF